LIVGLIDIAGLTDIVELNDIVGLIVGVFKQQPTPVEQHE
jgi:hypothetical protein